MMPCRPVRARVLALAFGGSMLVGCGSTAVSLEPPETQPEVAPTYAEVPCPEDVEVRLLMDHACGRLTVLERRDDPAGRTIEIFVVRIDPPSGAGASDPMLAISGDIGNATDFGGVAPLAERVQRTAFVVEPRGVGHSEPTLRCHEVNALAADAVSSPLGDPRVRERYLAAVGACRTRLDEAGVDVSAYDTATAAADIADLRHALGIDSWNLIGFGSYSRVLIEAARLDPGGVRLIVLDSPQLPDPGMSLIEVGMAGAIQRLHDACASDASCDAIAPDLSGLLDVALSSLTVKPVSMVVEDGTVAEADGGPVQVLVDGAAFVRVVRSILGGDGPVQLAQLPATISAASNGELSDQVLGILGDDPTLCAGYRPTCVPAELFSLGAYLSVLCRDEAAWPVSGGGDPLGVALDKAFGDDLHRAACEPWGVEAADANPPGAVAGNVPLLVLVGEFDAFTPQALIAEALDGRPNTHVLEVPGQTHNVLGFSDCALAIRNAWVDQPVEAPADTSCLDDLAARFEPGS